MDESEPDTASVRPEEGVEARFNRHRNAVQCEVGTRVLCAILKGQFYFNNNPVV